MSSITIRKLSITDLQADAVVNAANSALMMGGGVCGYIFRGAGVAKMTAACMKIGHCPTGSAVITPGFNLPAKNVIHAVGPVWHGGKKNEPELLYSAYKSSLEVSKENDLHSIGFPRWCFPAQTKRRTEGIRAGRGEGHYGMQGFYFR